MKLLLVEDDEMIQRMYARAFSEAGFEVVTAPDGQQAIDTVPALMPNIILMDVMMPNVNGMQALEALKGNDNTKSIPIIMLSADDDGVLMMKALQLGASRYLVKSQLEPSEVLAIANTVLSGS